MKKRIFGARCLFLLSLIAFIFLGKIGNVWCTEKTTPKPHYNIEELKKELQDAMAAGPSNLEVTLDMAWAGAESYPEIIDATLWLIQIATEPRCMRAAVNYLYAPKSPKEVGQERYDAIVSTLTKLLEHEDGSTRYFAAKKMLSIGKYTERIVYEHYNNFLKKCSKKNVLTEDDKVYCITIISEIFTNKKRELYPAVIQLTRAKDFLKYYETIERKDTPFIKWWRNLVEKKK